MELKANNFTGYLPDGTRYRVRMEDLERKYVDVSLWVYKNDSWRPEYAFSNRIKENIHKALYKGLREIEETASIELIKREPKLKISA